MTNPSVAKWIFPMSLLETNSVFAPVPCLNSFHAPRTNIHEELGWPGYNTSRVTLVQSTLKFDGKIGSNLNVAG